MLVGMGTRESWVLETRRVAGSQLRCNYSLKSVPVMHFGRFCFLGEPSHVDTTYISL